MITKELNKVKGIFKETHVSGVLLALVLIIVIASLVSPYFLTSYNLQAVIRSLAFVSIVAIGQACLLILGERLSISAIAGLCGVLGGILMVNASVNPYLAFCLMSALGAGFGLINGILVTGLKLNSLVVTIGMSGVYGGINLVISKGKAITGIPKEIYFWEQGKFLGVPMPFVIMLVVLIVVMILTRYTPFGRYMYAIGNSSQAAEILGIKVRLVRTVTFMIVGLLAALAGMVMVARLGSSQPSIGLGSRLIKPLLKEEADMGIWIETCKPYIDAFHLQQTDGMLDRHWDFTKQGLLTTDLIRKITEEHNVAHLVQYVEVVYAFEETDEDVYENMRRTMSLLQDTLGEGGC